MFSSHLNALLKKNFLILKRTYILSTIEILSPIIVMLLFWRLKAFFKIENLEIEDDIDYIYTNGTYIRNYNSFMDLLFFGGNYFCYGMQIIALIGEDFPNEIKEKLNIKTWDVFKSNIQYYNSLDELNDYIRSDKYETDDDHPGICFGLSYEKIDNKYKFKMHYFASPYVEDEFGNYIPSTSIDNLDPFRTQPDFISFEQYLFSGFLMIHKIIYDFILQKETHNPFAEIKFRIMAQKYDKYLYNVFNNFLSMILGFFVLIAYALPLAINIYKLVKEKETRAKEGMKIMGLNEFTYFLSYFIIYFIINIIYALCNTFILSEAMPFIEKIYFFFFFLLFGLVIYSLVYFFQSFLEKSRIAIILSLLIYCSMFFIALPIYPNSVSRGIKIVFCLLFPPITMQLGLNTISNFQINFNHFKGRVFMRYNKISFFDMYILFICNFILYIFLGFYFQNVISHEFGIKKPWYFLFTKKFWGCEYDDNNIIENDIRIKNNIEKENIIMKPYKKNNIFLSNDEKITKSSNNKLFSVESTRISSQRNLKYDNDKTFEKNEDNEYFEDEKKYEEYNNNDILQIKYIHKIFDDGKKALDGVSFNLYRNEIFALLGHNGAGKTTLINILTGLYQVTSGLAIYNSYNILSSDGIEKFRKFLGICPQHDILFNDLTVEEHLSMFCVFKSVDKSKIHYEVSKVIKDFGLEEEKNKKVESLSGGQKRKLSIAIAVVGGSSVIFLDEPTSGMDITSRRNLWDILKKSLSGKIIILTTHYMEEASVLGNRIGILSEGKMKCIGSPLFLIEKLGKNINLNITKKAEANNEEIINFINNNIGNKINIENEIFNEEILFRIPKKDNKSNIINYNWSSFFENLDKECEQLNIRNYSISMSSLEDVFINLSKLIKENQEYIKEIEIEAEKEKNNKILYDESNYNAEYNIKEKILRDAKVSFKKRIFQIYRDKKTFLLEILCPILLALIGCIVGSIEFLEKNRTFPFHINQITNESQLIFYSYADQNLENTFEDLFIKYSSEDLSNINFSYIQYYGDFYDNRVNYLNQLYYSQKQIKEKNYAYYIISEINKENQTYEFNCFVDLISRQSIVIYPNYLLNNIVRYAAENKNLEIEIINEPLPYTKKEIKDKQNRNEAMILFFISLSFTLIPSNFITIIIKERESNSKHLQIISGISLFSYWFNNYLFELVKYYIIGGICILFIYIFKFYQDYLYILYLEYGPAMVSFTYLFSFIFQNEDKGQTVVLLINLIIGALGGSAIIIMRLKDDLIKYAQPIIYIFRLIPSFCFCYGYNQLMKRNDLFYIDRKKKLKYITRFTKFNPKDILKLKYFGGDCLYLAIESIVYLLILIFLENFLTIFKCYFISNKNIVNNLNSIEIENKNKDKNIINENNLNNISIPDNVNDTYVKNEIIKAKDMNNTKKYAIKVQNLIKIYYGGPFGLKIFSCNESKSIKAISNISFCLDYGEVFGFLGINGSGKTTTFKCLSNEILPSSGTIYIDNKEITSNFNKIRSLIGYCPQFDAIFDYLTVYENLEFYGLIKGAKKDKIDNIINTLIEEMNLSKFKNKVSGTLSGGNKRKLSVAIALICNPPIILLDEPSTGMDPEARRFMWGVIHRVSLNQKKSAIIMTTHSMEEAETLCKRIGILVDGQFKCLSTSDKIKEKYGYGYEINLQINIPDINELYKIFCINIENKKQDLDFNHLEDSLKIYGLEKYYCQIKKELLGGKIYEELELKGYISLDKILLWVFYLKNILGMIKIIMNYFNEIFCVDYGGNNYVFKIKRDKVKGEKSIGFLFGLIEDNKNDYNIGHYFLQFSSLEQIFNKFAKENQRIKYISNVQNDILITKELIDLFE